MNNRLTNLKWTRDVPFCAKLFQMVPICHLWLAIKDQFRNLITCSHLVYTGFTDWPSLFFFMVKKGRYVVLFFLIIRYDLTTRHQTTAIYPGLMKDHDQQARASENFAGPVDFETPRPDLYLPIFQLLFFFNRYKYYDNFKSVYISR